MAGAAEPIELGSRLVVDPREWDLGVPLAALSRDGLAAGPAPKAQPGSASSSPFRRARRSASAATSRPGSPTSCSKRRRSTASASSTSAAAPGSSPWRRCSSARAPRSASTSTPPRASSPASTPATTALRRRSSPARWRPWRARRRRHRFEVVVLNVLPHEIADELGEVIAQLAPGGDLLVSGVLATEAAAVTRAIATFGCETAGEIQAGEWVGLRFTRRTELAGVTP